MDATLKQKSALDRWGIVYDSHITKAEASALLQAAIENRKPIDTAALKAQHPIEAVVAQFTQQQIGRDHKIFPPWREESTPSLHIYSDSGNWKDYGTGESGDIFDLIGRIRFANYDRSVHFIDVVNMLGDLNIQPAPRPQPAKRRARPHSTVTLERIMQWSDALPAHYRQYWRSRGLTDQTIDRFLLGYDGRRLTIPALYRGVPFAVRRRVTPEDWAVAKAAFTAQIAPWQAAHPDWTNRQIVQAMRAQLTAEHPEWSAEQIRAALPHLPPKYVGLDHDTVGIFNADVLNRAVVVIICEGELDCMLLDQAGFAAVTATGGAGAWRPEWMRFLLHCRTVYLLFDNDEAGRQGRQKLHAMLRRARPLTLPAGVKDVGELWEQGNLPAWLAANVRSES